MRFIALVAAAAALFAGPAFAAGYGEFNGNWRNDDASTRDLTRLRVTISGGGISVRAWGQCHPSDCDWGTVPGVAYSYSPAANPAVNATDIIATFNPGFAQTTLILTDRPGDRLSYAIFTRFTDGSGRRAYVARGTMRKHGGGWPGWPPGGPGGGWPPGGPGGGFPPGGPGGGFPPGGPGGGFPPGGPGGGSGITIYEDVNFAGASQLINSDTPNLVPMGWNDIVSSLRISGPGAWEICEHANYAGRCRVVSGDVPNLVPGGWNDMVSSIRRAVGGPGGPGGGWPPGGPGGGGSPVTHSTGPLAIPQTYLADLDEGMVVNNSTADIWFEAVTAGEFYITPRNGARMWVGDGSNRGFDGCSSGGSYSSARVSFDDLPIGTYVCVRTNGGHYSQFRMNSLSGGYPKTLTIGYTTWE